MLSTAAACLGKAKNSSKPEKKSGFSDEGLRQKKSHYVSMCAASVYDPLTTLHWIIIAQETVLKANITLKDRKIAGTSHWKDERFEKQFDTRGFYYQRCSRESSRICPPYVMISKLFQEVFRNSQNCLCAYHSSFNLLFII